MIFQNATLVVKTKGEFLYTLRAVQVIFIFGCYIEFTHIVSGLCKTTNAHNNNTTKPPNAESALLTHLLSNYDVRVRPRHNSAEAVQLDMEIHIESIEALVCHAYIHIDKHIYIEKPIDIDMDRYLTTTKQKRIKTRCMLLLCTCVTLVFENGTQVLCV